MEQFILRINGITTLDLEADYRNLVVKEWSSSDIPSDCYIVNNNKTMSVLKYVKNSDHIESLWCLSFVLDCKLNGRLSGRMCRFNIWCSKCRKDVRCYEFDNEIYKAINTGNLCRCITCTDSQLRFSRHTKYKDDYEFTKYGNNYVHKNNYKDFYIFSENKYTILELNHYDLKYHLPLKKKYDETHEYYDYEKIKCTVCQEHDKYEWKHNKTCIHNINKFCVEIYSKIYSLINLLDDMSDDVKSIIITNLILMIRF